jgi:hypothetical protein
MSEQYYSQPKPLGNDFTFDQNQRQISTPTTIQSPLFNQLCNLQLLSTSKIQFPKALAQTGKFKLPENVIISASNFGDGASESRFEKESKGVEYVVDFYTEFYKALQEALLQLKTETIEQTFDLSEQETDWQFLEDDIDELFRGENNETNPFKSLFTEFKATIKLVKTSLHSTIVPLKWIVKSKELEKNEKLKLVKRYSEILFFDGKLLDIIDHNAIGTNFIQMGQIWQVETGGNETKFLPITLNRLGKGYNNYALPIRMLMDSIKNVGPEIADIQATYTTLTNNLQNQIPDFNQNNWNKTVSILAIGVLTDYLRDSGVVVSDEIVGFLWEKILY